MPEQKPIRETPERSAGVHRKLARNSSSVLLASIISAVAFVATTIITARLLGPTGRGQLTLATLLATLIVTLGSLGLGAAATYYAARGERDRSTVLGSSVLLGLALGVVIVTAGVLTIVFGHVTLHGIPASYLLLAILVIPFSLVMTNVQSVFLGLQRFREYNLITIGQAVLPLLLVGVALLILSGGVRAAIIATTLSTILLAVVTLVAAIRAISVRWRLDRSYVRAAASYGLRVHIANVLGFLGYRLDVFVLNAYASPAAVGLYAAAVSIAERLWMLSQAVSIALFPRIAEEKDENVRRSITPLLTRNTLWLTAAAGVLMWALSTPIVTILFSSKFESSVGALRALLPGIVTFAAARVLENDIAARGRPIINSYLTGTSVVLNLGLNLILIPRHGIAGAAWASTISYSVLFAATLVVYCKIADVSVRTVIVPTRSDAAAYFRLARRLLSRPAAQESEGLELATPITLPDGDDKDS